MDKQLTMHSYKSDIPLRSSDLCTFGLVHSVPHLQIVRGIVTGRGDGECATWDFGAAGAVPHFNTIDFHLSSRELEALSDDLRQLGRTYSSIPFAEMRFCESDYDPPKRIGLAIEFGGSIVFCKNYLAQLYTDFGIDGVAADEYSQAFTRVVEHLTPPLP